MNDDQALSSLPVEKQLAKLDDIIKAATQEKERLGAKSARTDISDRIRRGDEAAALFARMSPRERTELMTNDKEEWARLLEATREQGMRKLLGWR